MVRFGTDGGGMDHGNASAPVTGLAGRGRVPALRHDCRSAGRARLRGLRRRQRQGRAPASDLRLALRHSADGHQSAGQHRRRGAGADRARAAAEPAGGLCLWVLQQDRGARCGVGRDLRAQAVQSGQAVRDAAASMSTGGRAHLTVRRTTRLLRLHPAFGEESLEPVDVIIAVDDVLGAHKLAEQRQRRLDSIHHEFVERALQSHQAFGAGLAVHDQLADHRVVERRDRVALIDR